MIIYTAITGWPRDPLHAPEVDPTGHQFCVFSDEPISPPAPWTYRPAVYLHPDPTRASRYHKILGLHLFPDAHDLLWIDATSVLRRIPSPAEFAVFRHPLRRDIYEEVEACIRYGKDDPHVLRAQADGYRKAGLPARSGLFENGLVLRQQTPKARALSALWWNLYCNGSRRDQVSLPMACWQMHFWRRTSGR